MTSPKSILHLGLCHYPKVRNKSQKVSRSFQKCVLSLSVMSNSVTPAHQASQSMGFSRQGYWSGLPFFVSRGSSQPRH